MPKAALKLNTFNKLESFFHADLFHSAGLEKLDNVFNAFFEERNAPLFQQFLSYRSDPNSFSVIETSELLIESARFLEEFITQLFNIEDDVHFLKTKTLNQNPVALFKKHFVLRRVKKLLPQAATLPPFQELDAWLTNELSRAPLQSSDKELAIALLADTWLTQSEMHTEALEKLAQWCAQALTTAEGRLMTAGWTSFRIPERIDHQHLVPVKHQGDCLGYEENEWRLRDGFDLTDPRMTLREVQDEVHYCVYCHDHEGDFCSKGFPVKKGDPSQGLKKNPLNLTLTGCPLEEKISEMHVLKRDGFTIAALATIMIDNPMCPATGHRICNDCMKACIYQKQDPVNIPQIETSVLTEVLHLPWGVEIYDLLTRWNPLRRQQPILKPYNGLKVLIAGMGPAGFTLAHHLSLEGFAVVGFDGLKIEPLAQELINNPICRFDDLKEALDERIMAGFGGVAEYGITVRWDKNFLKLIYLTLMRRPTFQVFGGIRFGGTITVEDAWEMGFDHMAVAVGAGLPKTLGIPGSLAPGMRQANDFLMALQLGNAAKKSSLTNLQLRLPAVIIGGGLTGVDTATEAQAYYITQIEKIQARYQELIKIYSEGKVLKELDIPSQEILQEFLNHAQAVQAERIRAKSCGQRPNFIKLIRAWGGVTIAYRRSMQESPAYINNHEELKKAFEEGIYYREALEPSAVELDEHGHVDALICRERKLNDTQEWQTTQHEVRLPARSILVATGTQPNIAYEFEHRGTFNRLGLHYQHYEEEYAEGQSELVIAHGIKHCKEPNFGAFTSYKKNDHRVSLIGDSHPVFHGNVVKAIASGLRTYPKILASLQNKLGKPGDMTEYQRFSAVMAEQFKANIIDIKRRSAQVIELDIQAPLAARHFKPGQFYRLQNFETHASQLNNTLLQLEPLALIAAGCNKTKGILKFLVMESGASSKLCALLQPGEQVSLMGPAGVRYKTPEGHETVLIVGNALSIPSVLSYGPQLHAVGSRLIFLGYFNNKEEFAYCQKELENAADVIIWVTDDKNAISNKRPQDYITSGDCLEALHLYAQGKLAVDKKQPEIPLYDLDRIHLIGGGELLRRFQAARHSYLKEFLIKEPTVQGSVYSLMQCMLKGVCAQCLQWQIDPETGLRTKAVFACSWPEQPLEIIDTEHIDARLTQNRLQEHLSRLWVDYLFEKFPVNRV
jgi:NADPH-dependent glutamate synthase beta subunit-like oxidoreductase/NAD(P)H-flavin reductase